MRTKVEISARQRLYRKTHREAVLSQQRAYHKRPEIHAKHLASSRRHNAKPTSVIKKYIRSARARGIGWALSDGLAIDLITDNCFYCGIEPLPVNGIDRVDNCVGYTEGNSVTACKFCNTAKLDRTREEFEAWAIRVAERTDLYNAGAGLFY